MLTDRPCGVCRALVPADTGCAHWRPKDDQNRAIVDRRYREGRRSQQAAREELVNEFAEILKRSTS